MVQTKSNVGFKSQYPLVDVNHLLILVGVLLICISSVATLHVDAIKALYSLTLGKQNWQRWLEG